MIKFVEYYVVPMYFKLNKEPLTSQVTKIDTIS